MDQELVLLHGSGPGDLQFSPDGALMITSGQDARICVLETANAVENNSEEIMFECDSSDPVTCLSVFTKENDTYEILTANENRIISVYSCSSNKKVYVEQTHTLTKFPLSPFSVDVSKKDGVMAISGGDSDIHLAYPGAEIQMMAGCRPDVVDVCFDPKGEYLASSSTSGTVTVFQVASKDLIKTFDGQIPKDVQVNGESCTRWRSSWHPEGSLLALPGATSIKLIKRATWSTAAMLTDGHKHPVTMTSWSSNGLYIASSDSSGKTIVWDLKTRKIIREYMFTSGVSSLKFCPAGNVLAVLTSDGDYSLMKDVIPAHMKLPSSLPLADVGTYTKGTSTSATAAKTVAVGEEVAKVVAKEEEVEPKKTLKPAAALKKKSPGGKKKKTTKRVRIVAPEDEKEEEEEEEEELITKKSSKKKKKTLLDDDDDDDDDEEMLDGDLAALKAKFTVQPSSDAVDVSSIVQEVRAADHMRTIVQQTPETPLQDVFQPGATYPRDGVKRRYLCWNLIGSITTREEEGYNAVEIEFSDSSSRRPVRFSDNYDFVVASLGKHGALFASEGSKRTASTIFYKPFDSWAHNAEWTLTLPQGDAAQTVAVGAQWCAVSTSSGYLRCFRASGLQLAPILAPGPVVSMAASGSSLVVVYHASCPLTPTQGGTQNLSFVLYDVDGDSNNPLSCVGLVPREVSRGTLPLLTTSSSSSSSSSSNNSSSRVTNLLEWIGFDEQQRMYAFDTLGRMFVLSPQDLKTWMLTMDVACSTNDKVLLRSSEESHWIVGVAHGRVMSTVCKGREKVDRQPRTMPKPLLTALPLGTGILLSLGSGEKKSGGRNQTSISLAETNFHQQAAAYSQQRRYEHDHQETPLTGSQLVQAQSYLDRSILQLMSACIKSENPTMALDLASRLHVEKSFGIAMKIARAGNQETLATKIYELMEVRMEAILKIHQEKAVVISSASSVVVLPSVPSVPSVRSSAANAPSPSSTAPLEQMTNDDDDDKDQMETDTTTKRRDAASLFGRNLKRKRTADSTNVEVTPSEKKESLRSGGEPSSKKTDRKAPVNPFMKKSMASPQKRVGGGGAGDVLSKLAGSPTPSKPVLGRQSSFHAKTLAKREKHF